MNYVEVFYTTLYFYINFNINKEHRTCSTFMNNFGFQCKILGKT